MELYLQFGYGMMDLCRELVGNWHGGTVILSPRDLEGDQLSRLAAEIVAIPNGRVLLDPQFYLPHSNHKRLCEHEFWPEDYDTNQFWIGNGLPDYLENLIGLNLSLRCAEFIVPGLLAPVVNDLWLGMQRAVISMAASRSPGMSLLATIALSSDAVRDQNQIPYLLEHSIDWPVDGYYVVLQHPSGNYLVTDAGWLANALDLLAGLKLRGKTVILGYCNEQMLLAATAKIDAIASGNFLNVRSFPPEKFRTEEEERKQKTTWDDCPQALSEYKLTTLDLANRQGLLLSMAAPPGLDGGYASRLFGGAQPSAFGSNEPAAFRHYLHCLHEQAVPSVKSTFDETIAYHESPVRKRWTFSNLAIWRHQRPAEGFPRSCGDQHDGIGRSAKHAWPYLGRRWLSI